MIELLAKLFVKNKDDVKNPETRTAYGTLCGIVGIVLNIFLFAVKFFAGILSGSVAVTADAFNNLSDAGSSVITLIGFRLSAQKPDKAHPFGHGRYEYITGLLVSIAIVLMGFELAKGSFDKILHPEAVHPDILTFIILAVSVVVKLYMSLYNKKIGKKISSAAMLATSADSLSDMCSTAVVLLTMIISHFIAFPIDGYCGMLVSLFIMYAGVHAAKETIDPLLGLPPTKEFVEDIEKLVMSYDGIVGIHDLVVHDYGPGRVMVSLHAEVDENSPICEIHDVIDNVECALSEKLGCHAVIHMDPVATTDEHIKALREQMAAFVKNTFGEETTIHDFRTVRGPTHTNLIFDIVLPYAVKLSDDEVTSQIASYAKTMDGHFFTVVKVDRSYV